MMAPILNVQGLETQFRLEEGTIRAVNGISFQLNEGEILGIVGESGCGKSVTMMSILRLIPAPPGKVVAGQALYKGRDLLAMKDEEFRQICGSQISMIFQDPMTSFNPVLTIGRQIAEPLEAHLSLTRGQVYERVVELMTIVGIPNPKDRFNDYPHQFSGGMRQRVMIAMALACSPQILIADEPTTALDVTIQAQIIELVKELRDKLGMAIIWITHDLGVTAGLVDRVLVLYAGLIIEEASVEELYAHPEHPYTIALLGSLPRMDAGGRKRLVSIEGKPPVLYEKPTSCPFAPRCKYRIEHCSTENPLLMQVRVGHTAACWVDPKTGKERS
ncbi:MAG: ABC transporter ATP-binding protein [Anaerolineales bacterium]|jgi:oligopeptide transport system ATP-binding protein